MSTDVKVFWWPPLPLVGSLTHSSRKQSSTFPQTSEKGHGENRQFCASSQTAYLSCQLPPAAVIQPVPQHPSPIAPPICASRNLPAKPTSKQKRQRWDAVDVCARPLFHETTASLTIGSLSVLHWFLLMYTSAPQHLHAPSTVESVSSHSHTVTSKTDFQTEEYTTACPKSQLLTHLHMLEVVSLFGMIQILKMIS